ncbi:MAG: M14/M99 family metallopeptidase [Thermodesulfobacteriota bacterium]|nr:M14/M99 family metallopeptidase [Thermodesulfobacteriota bacterium]
MFKKNKQSGIYTGCKAIVIVATIIFAFFLSDVVWPDAVWAQKKVHTVFFEGTDHELDIYKIYGGTPGKTLLLIGGIQGDEPGGFLSADHYADISLAKGSLIVVPRANFKSIVLYRRKVNDDMNRKFAEDRKNNYETKIVEILKKLINESDCLLNLHDGSGFYSDRWEGPDRNPERYGQSIISDSEVYINSETGETIDLGAMARWVADRINKNIKKPLHYFRFNNHKTSEKNSLHKEQRKSATYYALYTCGIPAFGIETSKSLPLELKVRHHNLAINAFMEKFDIIPETPGLNLDKPVLDYLILSINDSLPIVVKNQETLHINSGDNIMISHIEANYERGLSADVIGYGSIRDVRKKIRITGPTRIVARKDYFPCGSVYVVPGESRRIMAEGVSVSKKPTLTPYVHSFKAKINGKKIIYKNNDHVKLIKGDTFELVDVIGGPGDPSDMIVNFKGFVGNASNNTGEDRGYVINTAEDLWKNYSLDKKGLKYKVIVTYNKQKAGELFIDLEKPALDSFRSGTD